MPRSDERVERDEHDEPEPSPYLRRSRRPEVRRRSRWKRLALIGLPILLVSTSALAAAGYGFVAYLTTSPRFALQQPETVVAGEHISPDVLAQMFSLDVGRSIYEVPLETRRQQLMALPWVESAYVMRAWPNRLRLVATERRPVAFVRLAPPAGARGSQGRSAGLSLIDREGVLLPLPARGNFPFPVLTGLTEEQPLAERRRRVRVLLALLADLDSETPPRSGEISEVDLSDASDAAITVTASGSAILVHLGDAHFLARYKLFQQNLAEWRAQYGTVRTVDLRFEKQVIVQP
jgi:cell division protein FtsQ